MSDPSPWARPTPEPGSDEPDAPAEQPPGEPEAAATAETLATELAETLAAEPAELAETLPAPPETGTALAETLAAEPAELAETLAGEDTPAPPDAEPVPAPPAPPPPSPTASGALIPIIGLMLLVLAGLAVGLIIFATSGDDDPYPTNLPDGDYDLEGMALRLADLPMSMQLSGQRGFTNEEWALVVSNPTDDPELKLNQLVAQGRLRGTISAFSWPGESGYLRHLAQTRTILSQSTLYESETRARESISGRAGAAFKPLCGLLLDETGEINEFAVPQLGDQSAGFFVITADPDLGNSIDTVVCFRTGRVVHGVIQSALEGAEDIALVIQLAQRMLAQTQRTFEGNPAPMDEIGDGG